MNRGRQESFIPSGRQIASAMEQACNLDLVANDAKEDQMLRKTDHRTVSESGEM